MSTTKPFPFLHEVDDQQKTGEDLKPIERKQRDQDWEDAKYMIDYRRNSGFDAKARRGMVIYNVVQTAKPEDEVSRLFLGGTRTIIDKGMEQMTEGEPDFDFEPFGPSDHKKTIVWKHMMKMMMSNCNYRVHQELFLRDYFVMGSGVLEVFTDYPQRTIRVPNDSKEDGFEEVVVRDHRRPKVGIRALNPLMCWRNPNITDSTQVPSSLKKRLVTWNQFAQDYGRATLNDGTPKFKNLDKIAKGTHVCIWEYQDEIRDVYRIYASPFGTESDGWAKSPPMDTLGVPIFNKSLKIHEVRKNGQTLRSDGLNILGMCNTRWGTFFDKYDNNYQGTHAVYGMGIPERIEGEDMAMQTLFNQYLDNERWANTIALNYKGDNADSYMDIDANRLYGGELIDGEITPMPMGISRQNNFTANQETMDKILIPATGINYNQLVGDTSKTAFEFAQRIRQANRGAEQRLQRLENEVFKPVGTLMLSGALSEMTVPEYEDMTEEQVNVAKDKIKRGGATLDDYQDLNGKEPKKRLITSIPVKGEKLREDFTKTKKRKLDYNSSDNTLIFDKSLKESTSYIPLVEEYIVPAEYIESGLLPDVIVDSKRMLGDMKAQSVENVKAANEFIVQLMQLGYQNADLDKMVTQTLEFANIDTKDILKDAGTNEEESKRKEILKAMQQMNDPTTPLSNAQVPPQGAPQPSAGTPQPVGQQQPAPPAALGGVAQGGL